MHWFPDLSWHAPQVQLFWQTFWEQASQPPAWVVPAWQGPSPEHAPKLSQVQSLRHVRVCCPQLPQVCTSVLPGEHTPPEVHVDQVPQLQLESHVRLRAPQAVPQASVACSPELQTP